MRALHNKNIYSEPDTDAEFQIASVLASEFFAEYACETEQAFAEERAEYIAELAAGTGDPSETDTK